MALVDDSDTGGMVLRTVFLPQDVDDTLRDYAFVSGIGKGDLLRNLIRDGLNQRLGVQPGTQTAQQGSKKSAGRR